MKIVQLLKLKALLRPLAVVIMLWGAWMGASAQFATISPQAGKLIAAKTDADNEQGFLAGWCSMWRHNQIGLTYVVSDWPTFTGDDMMANHTCNLKEYSSTGTANVKDRRLVHMTGYYASYSELSVPRGYRIKGYKIVIKNNLDTNDPLVNDVPALPFARKQDWTFGEVDKSQVYRRVQDAAPTYKGTPLTLNASNFSRTDASVNTLTLEKPYSPTQDLGNTLYFCFRGNSSNYLAAFTYERIEIYFAPDVPFDVTFTGDASSAAKVSLAESRFKTGKTDIGPLTLQKKVNAEGKSATYLSYTQSNIEEMRAGLKLYEQGAVTNGTWDANAGNKNISSVVNNNKLWSGFKNGTYYLETPTHIEAQGDGEKSNLIPIGYRITGAKFRYTHGQTDSGESGAFYLSSKDASNNTVYLNVEGTKVAYVKSASEASLWRMSGNDIYTTTASGNAYLAISDYVSDATLGNIYPLIITSTPGYENWGSDANGVYYGSYGDLCFYNGNFFVNEGGTAAPVPVKENALPTTPYVPQAYTLKVYDKSGANPKTVSVTTSSADGTFELTGLNNDAVKFEISGLPTADEDQYPALLNVTLTLEPLDPFPSAVDVVCSGNHGEEIVRTADFQDFQIAGEGFTMHVPVGFNGSQHFAKISYRNLKSDRADNTYLNNPMDGNSRYSFVGSDYQDHVAEDLYANKNIVEDYDYTKKIATTKVGNIEFRFNNAWKLDNEIASLSMQPGESFYLEEYPFSIAAYKASKGYASDHDYSNPDEDQGVLGSDFATVKDKEVKFFYIFTSDETRYNIAPTTKEMHNMYAFYQSIVRLAITTYTAKVEWIPIYNTTNYYKDADNTHNNLPMYGAKITTTETGDGTTYGPLTLNDILLGMKLNRAHASGYPASLEQVLYVDMHELQSVISGDTNTETSNGVITLDAFRSQLAKNALLYLPFNSKVLSTAKNAAVMNETKTGYQANTDYVLTDKNPFYAPYDVQLSTDNYAKYQRDITLPGMGRVNYATVVLPYALTIDADGKHTNDSGTGNTDNFFLAKMKEGGLQWSGNKEQSGTDYQATAVFQNISSATKTEPNKAYLVTIPEGVGNNSISFKAYEKEALIKATPAKTTSIENGSVKNKIGDQEANFFNYYTFSGTKLPKADNPGVFYFSLDKFVALKNYKGNELSVQPFRSYYNFEGAPALAQKMIMFGISFDEIGDNETDGINDLQEDVALCITTSNQTIWANARKEATLSVYSLSGQTVCNTLIHAGETKTINVPSGVYLVNGKKIIVK